MALRTAHGTGAPALLRVETTPADELPLGVQAPLRAEAGSERRPNGTFARGGRTVQSVGGLAKRGKSRLVSRLGLAALPDGNTFAPYRRAASTFRRVQCAELARTVGGRVCGPAPSSIVASAALALAWSRYFSDQAAVTGDAELAIRALRAADASRQGLLTAHELCAREAQARPRPNAVEAMRARILREGKPYPPFFLSRVRRCTREPRRPPADQVVARRGATASARGSMRTRRAAPSNSGDASGAAPRRAPRSTSSGRSFPFSATTPFRRANDTSRWS